MVLRVGVVGAGLCGRLVALAALMRGYTVTLYDKDDCRGHHSCGWVAAGMLAPFTELLSSEPLLCRLGLDAIKQWPHYLAFLMKPVSFHQNGTLVVAHPQDIGELKRLDVILDYKLQVAAFSLTKPPSVYVAREQLNELIPNLSTSIQAGRWISHEGHIDTHEFYQSSTITLKKKGVTWYEKTSVHEIVPYQVSIAGETHRYDMVFDCRGLGAKDAWPQLRGVRGEVIFLQTKELKLNCPVRILHPRYPLYISPRANHTFVVGATSIEGEDRSAISAQSLLELLTACYMVHPGFAEARVTRMLTECRPTLPDNYPKIFVTDGLIRINGLYRHGYMIGPAIVDEAIQHMEQVKTGVKYPELLY